MTTKIIKILSSLKLAVLVLAAISVTIAIGTIVESKMDSEAANKLVYQTYWMWSILGLLSINLIAVMVDRWPWKVRHTPFILAHIGILILLFGSWVTQRFGIDGTMRIPIEQSNRFVVTNQTEMILFQSTDGQNYRESFKQDVDFFLRPPSEKNPMNIPTGDSTIELVDYKHYVIPQKKIIASTEPIFGSGLRFEIQNSRVNQIDWLVQGNPNETVTYDLGPAQIFLAAAPLQKMSGNAIYLFPNGPGVDYIITHKDLDRPYATGHAKEGDQIALGWMDLKLKILRFLPLAESTWDVTEKDHPTPLTTSAVKMKFQGTERWMLLDDTIRLSKMGAIMRFVYAHKRLTLKFPVVLKKFEVEHYEGTQKASAYKSVVEVPEQGESLISMNEPMKVGGLLFYQASFEEDARGQPTVSIFSINYDPGRWFKYVGSLIMFLGIISLFYFRKLYQKKGS